MSYAVSRADALDYAPCHYGGSKLVFRGPQKRTDEDYVAIIGGTETYGRFVSRPFSDLVEDGIGSTVINLGCQNAGIDAFLYDPDVMLLAKGARVTVLQTMGAQNMSNRFYRVHPRRNDRFLGPSDALKAMYREVDFTDFSFTRHMLSTLQMLSAEKFAVLRDELQQAWQARMQLLVRTIDSPVVILWLREDISNGLGAEPLFVGGDMVAGIGAQTLGVVEVAIKRAGHDLEGMVFGSMQHSIAAQMLGLSAHQDIAQSLIPVLQTELQK